MLDTRDTCATRDTVYLRYPLRYVRYARHVRYVRYLLELEEDWASRLRTMHAAVTGGGMARHVRRGDDEGEEV